MKKEMDILWQNAADIIVLDAPGGGNAPTLGGTDAPATGGGVSVAPGGGVQCRKLTLGGGLQ